MDGTRSNVARTGARMLPGLPDSAGASQRGALLFLRLPVHLLARVAPLRQAARLQSTCKSLRLGLGLSGTIMQEIAHQTGDEIFVDRLGDHLPPYAVRARVSRDAVNAFVEHELLLKTSCVSSLRRLELQYCHTVTHIPDEISFLTDLEHLVLNCCWNLVCLPHTVTTLTNLASLSLDFCTRLTSLPDGISTMTGLTCLGVNHCSNLDAPPTGVQSLIGVSRLKLTGFRRLTEPPSYVGALTKLTKLDLSLCLSLTGLPRDMANLSGLEKLGLVRCEGLTALPDSIAALTALTSLALGGCSGLTALPRGITALRNLAKLDLTGCSQLEALPSEIGALTSLRRLWMGHCRSLVALPDGVTALTRLTSLDVHACGGRPLRLPRSVRTLTNLEFLTLHLRTTPDAGGAHVPPEGLTALVRLSHLSLGNFGRAGELMSGIGALAALRTLYMTRCGVPAIPQNFSLLTDLRNLILTDCGLSRTDIPPATVHRLTRLTNICVSR